MGHAEIDIEDDGFITNLKTSKIILTPDNILLIDNLITFNLKNMAITPCEYANQEINATQYLKSTTPLCTEYFKYKDITNTMQLESNSRSPNKNTLFDNYTNQPHHILHRDYFQLFFKPQNMDIQVFTGGLQRYFITISVPAAERPAHTDTMHTEWIRVRSFWSFPANIIVSTLTMARVGLYYTGKCYQCKCFSCGVTFYAWYDNDDPYVIHLEKSPNCPFMNGLETNNDPIHDEDKYRPRHKMVECYRLIQTVESVQSEIIDELVTEDAVESIVEGESEEELEGAVGGELEERISTESIKHANEPLIKAMRDINLNSNTNSFSFRTNTPATTDATTSTHNNLTTSLTTTKNYLLPTNKSSNDHSATNDKAGISDKIPLEKPACANSSIIHQYKCNTTPDGIFFNLHNPKFPTLKILQTREKTFTRDWPHWKILPPHKMAEAGFFYLNYEDYVKCYLCGRGLRNFRSGDDPWVLHARWSSECSFLISNKGTSFVERVQNNLEKNDNQLIKLESSDNLDTEQHNTPTLNLEIAKQSLADMGIDDNTIALAINHWKITKKARCKTRMNDREFYIASELCHIAMTIQENELKALEINSTDKQNESENQITKEEQDTYNLLEEHQKRKDQLTCIYCLDQKIGVTFLPCGHMVCCLDCAPCMLNCPMNKCRQKIKGTIITYMQ